MSEPDFRSGFVSIIGRPNAGKSTLLNALVGAKIAIVADKPQTTRTSIQGVLTIDGAQVVFVDTPGIHKADSPINKRLMDAVRAALDDRDLLVFVADAALDYREADRHAVDLVKKSHTPAILALNKVDLLKDRPNNQSAQLRQALLFGGDHRNDWNAKLFAQSCSINFMAMFGGHIDHV